MVQFEGMSHNPVFTYQVNIGDMNAVGSGNSKKQAKHSAASKCLKSNCQILTFEFVLFFLKTENLLKLARIATIHQSFNAHLLLAFSDYFLGK